MPRKKHGAQKQRPLSVISFAAFAAACGYALFLLCALFFFALYRGETSDWARAAFLAVAALPLPLLIYGSYRLVYVPYKAATKQMHALNIGHGSDTPSAAAPFLSQETADMARRIQVLTEARFQAGASQKQAEYMALQSQIHPHFLYNTLEAIRGDALGAGLIRIAEITEALAVFFRYTVSTRESLGLVTLEDELNNIDNYFLIQRYRFEDRLALAVTYDSAACDYKLPKMTLQPIVENAIYHGVERKSGPGLIKIIVETTKTRLIINVVDDGVGMDEQKLNQLNDRLNVESDDGFDASAHGQARPGIALVNVHNRIRLLFGAVYGIRVTSAPGIGTDVEIVLPLKL